MPQRILIAVLVLATIAAASSAYTAFKMYQITEAKSISTKAKR